MPNEKNSATMLALPCRPTDVARTTTDGHQVPQQLPTLVSKVTWVLFFTAELDSTSFIGSECA